MSITVRGIPEVQRSLKVFTRTLLTECIEEALNRSADVFEQELRVRCPLSEKKEFLGHLLDHMVSIVELDTSGAKATIGFGELDFRALWVEYGHRMIGHKPNKKESNGPVRAHPFMRPSFDAAADRAFGAFVESVKNFMRR